MLLLLSAGFLPDQAQAKDKAPISPELLAQIRASNGECLVCHSEEGSKNPPRADMDLQKLGTLLHDPELFNGSNHGSMECKQCHGSGYGEFPHATDARDTLSPCEECHAVKVMKVEQQFEASVHAKNLTDKFTCSTCHNPHADSIASKLIDPRKIVAQDNRVCLGCHDSDEKFARFAPAMKSRPLIDEIHEWLPNTRLHWKAVRCIDCHTPAAKTLSHEILSKEKAERNCVTCHTTSSSLSTRLYRHLVTEEQEKYGFVNSVILSNTYVLGATRNPVLDTLLMMIFGALLVGLLVHGLGRILAYLVRRGRNNG